MDRPLDDSHAKAERAEEHIRSLNTEVAGWVQEMQTKGEVGRVRFEYDSESGWLEGFVDHIPQPPPHRFGLILGDIVHNLRGALDHLAWELANLASPHRGEDRSTQFPITLSAKEFAEGRVQRMIRYMDPSDVALIEKEQPWSVNPKGSEADHALAVLADLSNRDKHQGIHPISADREAFYVYPIPIRDCSTADLTVYGTNLELNAKLMRMRVVVTGPNPEMNVQGPFLPPTVAVQHGNVVARVDFVTGAWRISSRAFSIGSDPGCREAAGPSAITMQAAH